MTINCTLYKDKKYKGKTPSTAMFIKLDNSESLLKPMIFSAQNDEKLLESIQRLPDLIEWVYNMGKENKELEFKTETILVD